MGDEDPQLCRTTGSNETRPSPRGDGDPSADPSGTLRPAEALERVFESIIDLDEASVKTVRVRLAAEAGIDNPKHIDKTWLKERIDAWQQENTAVAATAEEEEEEESEREEARPPRKRRYGSAIQTGGRKGGVRCV